MIYVGIDPAFRHYGFGVAIYDDDEGALQLMRFKGFLEFQEYFAKFNKSAIFCVENSNIQNVTFIQSRRKEISQRLSRNAGANQAVSQLTVDWLRNKFGKDAVIEVSPREKGRKYSAATIELLCKSVDITCGSLAGKPQDALDALLLVILLKSRLWSKKLTIK